MRENTKVSSHRTKSAAHTHSLHTAPSGLQTCLVCLPVNNLDLKPELKWLFCVFSLKTFGCFPLMLINGTLQSLLFYQSFIESLNDIIRLLQDHAESSKKTCALSGRRCGPESKRNYWSIWPWTFKEILCNALRPALFCAPTENKSLFELIHSFCYQAAMEDD